MALTLEGTDLEAGVIKMLARRGSPLIFCHSDDQLDVAMMLGSAVPRVRIVTHPLVKRREALLVNAEYLDKMMKKGEGA